jgi:hypothetical protein
MSGFDIDEPYFELRTDMRQTRDAIVKKIATAALVTCACLGRAS